MADFIYVAPDATNARALIQTRLDAGRNVRLGAGTYGLDGQLQFKVAGQVLMGASPHSTCLTMNVPFAGDIITRVGNASGCRVSSLRIKGGNEAGPASTQNHTAGYAISFPGDGAAGKTFLAQVDNVWLERCYGGIMASDFNTLNIDNVMMSGMGGPGIALEATNGSNRADVVNITRWTYGTGRGEQSIYGTDPAQMGLYVSGQIHTVRIQASAIVQPYIGALIGTYVGSGPAEFPSFFMVDNLEVDYPYQQALLISYLDRGHITNSYFHGARASQNINIGQFARDVGFVNCNITGAAGQGIYANGPILDLIGCEVEWNSQATHNGFPAIHLGPTAQNVSLVAGGTGDGTSVFMHNYGCWKDNPATNVQLAAWRGNGVTATRNF